MTAADTGPWLDIATAPAEGNFIVAAWSGEYWVIGEAERDPDDLDQFWWANTRGDYHARTLAASGLVPKFWQPMPAEPKETPR